MKQEQPDKDAPEYLELLVRVKVLKRLKSLQDSGLIIPRPLFAQWHKQEWADITRAMELIQGQPAAG